MSDRFRISSLLPGQLAEHRISMPSLLRRAQLPAGLFHQEKVYATTREFFALWRAVGEASGDPAIGLKLGAETRLERFNPTAIAAVCSRTFRDALERVARYKRITCPEQIRIRTARGETSVEFAFLEETNDAPEVLVDLCMSWIISLGRRGTDRLVVPLRAEVTRPYRNRQLLETHLGCRVRFRSERNALVFRDVDVDLPFVTQNPDLLDAVRNQLESELEEPDVPRDVCEQVKHTLRRSLAGKRPSLPDVARALCTSTRTLQRRLTGAGLTFQQVVEETRRELARHYLSNSEMELNDAAYLLGYEDASSFFRAFNEWEGTSPGQWRALHATSLRGADSPVRRPSSLPRCDCERGAT